MDQRKLIDQCGIYSSRTNNISETYNHAINGQVMSSKSNVYKILDITKNQETLTSFQFIKTPVSYQIRSKSFFNLKSIRDTK